MKEVICWIKMILTSFLGMGSCSFKMSLVGLELLPGGVEGPAGGVGVFTAAAGETVGVLTPDEPGPPLPPAPFKEGTGGEGEGMPGGLIPAVEVGTLPGKPETGAIMFYNTNFTLLEYKFQIAIHCEINHIFTNSRSIEFACSIIFPKQ